MLRSFLNRLAVATLAGTLAAAMLPAAFTAAATPGWAMSVVSIPGTVSPGAVAAFKVTIKNNGKSNISKLFLTDNVAAAPVYATAPCPANVVLNCSLGALGAGKTKVVTVGYTTGAAGTFTVKFALTTTGVAYQNLTSHGDALEVSKSTLVNGSAGFAGGFFVGGGPIQTGQTTVNPPTTNIGVTIAEGGSGVACGTGIGTQADVNINDGATYAITPGTPLVVLKISTSGIPDEKKLGDFKVCHRYDNGTTVVLPKCANATDTAAIACFWPRWGLQTGDDDSGELDADDFASVSFDVYDVSNGGLRGGF